MVEVKTSPDWKAIFHQAMENSRNAIVLVDLEGRITFANLACERLFGYQREVLLKERLLVLYPPEVRAALRRIFEEAKAGGFGQGELELLRRDGTRLEGQVSMVLLQDEAGGYRKVIVINRDISELAALQRELEQQRGELAVRDELLHILSRSLDLEAGLEKTLEYILKNLAFRSGGIALVDRERGILIPRVQRGVPAALLRDLEGEPLRLGEGLIKLAMERAEPLVVEDLTCDPRVTRRTLRESGFKMLITVPLLAPGRIVGFLFLFTPRPLEVPAERLRLLQAIGDQLGVAVENLQLFRKERRHIFQLLLVERIAGKASSILDLDRLLDEVALEIQRAFNYHDVLIFFVDQERRELVRKAWAGHYRRRGPREVRLPITDRGILGWVIRHGRTALVNDVHHDPRYEAFFPETRSELCVPLRREGQVIGGINVESMQKMAFDETDATVLEALADQLVVALTNAELYGELEERVARRTAALRASQERLQALNQVAARIQGILDEERIILLATEEFTKLKLIGSFWSVEEGGRAIVRRHFAFPPQLLAAMRQATGSDPQGYKLSLDQVPHAVQKAITYGEIVAIDDFKKTLLHELLQSHPKGLEFLKQEIGGVVYAPLLVREESTWLMTFAFPQVTEDDIRTVKTFAHHLSVALENARLFRELECSYGQLKEAQSELLRMERLAAVGQLAGSIAHQLRNPLAVIKNSAFYLRSKLKGQEGKVGEHLELIEEEIRRMDRRIADLLSLAYRGRPHLRRLGLKSLIERVLAGMEFPPGIEPTLRFAGGPLQVEADPEQMKQLFYNIIENALQAMGPEGRLAIRGYEKGNGVVLELEDSGPGLPPEEAAQVFEPLFTTKAQGTGLGLTICKQIIAAHGGRIDFKSTEGEGSRVTVWLPRRRTEDD